jgi:hypothetical protein
MQTKMRFLIFLFGIFIIINFLIFSGLFERNSPEECVKRYYSALMTFQDPLAIRQLEEFDWKSRQTISRKETDRLFSRFLILRQMHGLIKNFEITDKLISKNSAEIKVKIKWPDGNEAIDTVKLSNKTGEWKIASAQIYY